jgi:hypothetical protein
VRNRKKTRDMRRGDKRRHDTRRQDQRKQDQRSKTAWPKVKVTHPILLIKNEVKPKPTLSLVWNGNFLWRGNSLGSSYGEANPKL